MFIDQITRMFSCITTKQVLVAILCISIAVFLYYSFVYEGFDNAEGCKLTSDNARIARQTIDKLNQEDVKMGRDQINVGYNLRDMHTRDIILGDDSKKWCKDEEVAEAPEAEDQGELYLFDGPGLMDTHEKESLADGIAYAGANDVDSKLAKA